MLRHPSFRGLREDKAPGDVTREMPAAVPSKPGRDADAARAVPRPSARKRTPTVRRRPPETPPRRRPPLKEPEPKPAVEEPPAKRRKRPVREPVDAAETPAGGFALTNPDRVLYPEQGLTKLDLARYAHAVAERMVPHAAGRPLMLLRCPEGRERCFFQKHPSGPLPESLAPIPVRERKGTATYVTLQDESGLLALVQMGVLEIHVWGARGDQLERPDRIVVDLDPHPSMPWAEVVEAARLARRRLEALDLVSFPKTTGGKGIHVVVPIRRGPGWDEVRAFTDWLAAELAREDPKRYSTRLSKERRGTRLFVDTLRNRRGATWVAPYSPRARAGAPVSMPLSWEDLDPRRGPDRYTVESVLRRGLPRTDPWRELGSARQTLTAAHRKAARSASARRPS